MMTRPSAAALVVVILLGAADAQKQKPPAKLVQPPVAEAMVSSHTQFSATMSGGILKESPKKVYRSGDLMRVDLTGNYHITDLRQRLTWAIHPDRCAMFPGPDVAVVAFAVMPDFAVERSSTEEREVIGGHPCKAENAVYTNLDSGKKTIAKLWRAADLQGFPLRIDVQTPVGAHYSFNFTDVSLQPPDPDLFKLPASCHRGRSPSAQPSPKASPKPATAAVKKPRQ